MNYYKALLIISIHKALEKYLNYYWVIILRVRVDFTLCEGFKVSCEGGVIGSSNISLELGADSSPLLPSLACTMITEELAFSRVGECSLQSFN